MRPEHGGGQPEGSPVVVRGADELEQLHRRLREAEADKSGEPVLVQFRGVPFSLMSTKEVADAIVIPYSKKAGVSYAQTLGEGQYGLPTFAGWSHAFA